MKDLRQGSIKNHIVSLAIPTVGGGLAFTLFNLTDTYFVGKLGTQALAAMGFTFPIILISSAVSMGITTGTMSVLSRAAGRQDKKKMKRIATDGLFLSIVLVLFFSILGLSTMDQLFPLLGADQFTLPLVKDYMSVWYAGILVVLMPPMSDSAMRAIGDTMRPFIVMLVCAGLNVILDPIMIFGWFGFPAMGIQGAAVATVISRFFGMLTTLYFLGFHHKLIDLSRPKLSQLMTSWKEILQIGLPGMGVMLFPQLLRTVLTALAASVGGAAAVAAIAVGSRIEGFVNIAIQGIGSSIVPIVGQNWGAGLYDRVDTVRRLLNRYAIAIGLGSLAVIYVVARPLTSLFTQDPEVVAYVLIYLRWILIGFVGMNLYNWNGQALNAVGKTMWTLAINAGGTVMVMMPLLFVGSKISFTWMLAGLALGQVLVGFFSIGIGRKQLMEAESCNHTEGFVCCKEGLSEN
ncbi:MATE family efflux transporter [Gottschalkiaceae bacterium SANA]|nr:MATE family efflux transporter [Gottschalkiaceae bacterium SANA]